MRYRTRRGRCGWVIPTAAGEENEGETPYGLSKLKAEMVPVWAYYLSGRTRAGGIGRNHVPRSYRIPLGMQGSPVQQWKREASCPSRP
jgi:hypothetical protein